jgi:hypothetical protein
VYAKGRPWQRREALGMNFLVALQTYPEAAILDAAEGRAGVLKLAATTVEIADRKCAFRGALNLIRQIRASLDRDPVALTGDPLQFSNPGRQNVLKTPHFIPRHFVAPLLL